MLLSDALTYYISLHDVKYELFTIRKSEVKHNIFYTLAHCNNKEYNMEFKHNIFNIFYTLLTSYNKEYNSIFHPTIVCIT